MLKSSQVMALNPKEVCPPAAQRSLTLRRAHSTESLNSPGHTKLDTDYDFPEPPHAPFAWGQVSAHHASSISGSPTPRPGTSHSRGVSFDGRGLFSRSQVHLPASSSLDFTAPVKSGKERTVVAKNISPTKFFSILSGTSSTQLDVEDIKKLRLLLRNESAR